MKIFYDENICVRCLACVSEAEFGGVTYERGQIVFDETKPEDWENIASICPTAAVKAIRLEMLKFMPHQTQCNVFVANPRFYRKTISIGSKGGFATNYWDKMKVEPLPASRGGSLLASERIKSRRKARWDS